MFRWLFSPHFVIRYYAMLPHYYAITPLNITMPYFRRFIITIITPPLRCHTAAFAYLIIFDYFAALRHCRRHTAISTLYFISIRHYFRRYAMPDMMDCMIAADC